MRLYCSTGPVVRESPRPKIARWERLILSQPLQRLVQNRRRAEKFENRLIAKTNGNSAALEGVIRRAVHDVDANQPVSDMKSMDARIAESLGPQRFAASLLAVFAVLATVLSAVGLYGLVSYSVTQRTNEMGIRMALGANRADILRMVLRESAQIAFIGAGAGIIAGLLVTRAIRGVLYGVSAYDPVSFAGSALALTFVALAASYVPARRASRVDPMVALRYE